MTVKERYNQIYNQFKTWILKLIKLPFVMFLMSMVKRIVDNKMTESARALTYTTLFALVPLITVFIVIISSIESLAPQREHILNMLYSNILPSAGLSITKYLNEFATASGQLTTVGIGFLFVTALMMLTQVEETFNDIWKIKVTRKGWAWFQHYWTLITIGPIVITAIFAVLSFLGSYSLLKGSLLEDNFTGYTVDLEFWLSVASFAISWLGFTILFWGMPNRDVPIKPAMISALFSAVTMTLLKNLFALFVTSFSSYQLVYGAFAAFPLLLIWIYSFWMIVLLGVEMSVVLTINTRRNLWANIPKQHSLLEIINLLYVLQRAQNQGKTISNNEATDILGFDGAQRWHDYAQRLTDLGYIEETADHQYILKQNLYLVSLYEFCGQFPYGMPNTNDIEHAKIYFPWVEKIAPALIKSEHYVERELNIMLANIVDDPARHVPTDEAEQSLVDILRKEFADA